MHDIGLHAVRNDARRGRLPRPGRRRPRAHADRSATSIREFLPRGEILNYLDAILRVYNRFGRRDNKYKARIKILVKELTPRRSSRSTSKPSGRTCKAARRRCPDAEIARLAAFFAPPAYEALPGDDAGFRAARRRQPRLRQLGRSATCIPHKVPGYAAVTLSLKKTGVPPGDATVGPDGRRRRPRRPLQLRRAARLARAEPDPRRRAAGRRCSRCGSALKALGFATPNIGLLTDIICCPGGDFCSLANAKSIPIAEAIQRRFDDLDYLHDIGELDLNISGCMNACGHHHVGHIGILGVDKNGEEWYQVSIGGDAGRRTRRSAR